VITGENLRNSIIIMVFNKNFPHLSLPKCSGAEE